MGMEFPKRDTDGPNVEWVSPISVDEWFKWCARVAELEQFCKDMTPEEILPSAADLDAVAEEQRVKEKTGNGR